jgi:predicted nucleic acid-binding protein
VRIEDALSSVHSLFLDTAPVIYHVEGSPRYSRLTDFLFGKIGSGQIKAVTSSITLAECLVHPYRAGNAGLVERFRALIMHGVNTHYVGIDFVVSEAAELRARYHLTLTDAFQVAAALSAGCDSILTNDRSLRRIAEIRILILDDLEIGEALI